MSEQVLTPERLTELRRVAEAATPGPWEIPTANVARRIAACVHACEGIPTEALEAGVIRDLINAATRYLRVMTRDTDDDPYCWAEEEHAEAHLREVLARVRGDK